MRIIFLIGASLMLFSSGCEPEECEGGSGGSVTVVARLYHHDRLIASSSDYRDTVYVKFNTKESPGSSLSAYDKYFVGNPGEDHVKITGLKCGEYYFLGAGQDTVSSPGNKYRVTGGTVFTTEKESGEIVFTVPVSE